jgi:hypothetical protein
MMKMGKTTNPNSTKGVPSVTGAKAPKGATASDASGERHAKAFRGGVAMGKEDAIGSDKEFNTGRTAGICYDHKRSSYAMEDRGQK